MECDSSQNTTSYLFVLTHVPNGKLNNELMAIHDGKSLNKENSEKIFSYSHEFRFNR